MPLTAPPLLRNKRHPAPIFFLCLLFKPGALDPNRSSAEFWVIVSPLASGGSVFGGCELPGAIGPSFQGHVYSVFCSHLVRASQVRVLSGKESACQSRRLVFAPWVGKIPWRRKWQPTPVFLPEKSHGQRSLEGYSLWGHKGAGHSLAT